MGRATHSGRVRIGERIRDHRISGIGLGPGVGLRFRDGTMVAGRAMLMLRVRVWR